MFTGTRGEGRGGRGRQRLRNDKGGGQSQKKFFSGLRGLSLVSK